MNFFTVEFSPASPASGASITATIASTSGPSCLPPATSLTNTEKTIVLRLDYEDFCQGGTPVASKGYDIGGYPSGNYIFEINACQDNPPPLPSPCNIAFQGVLAIGSQFNASVPAASLSSGILTFVGLALIGLIRLHVRRYYEHRMAA